MSKPNYSNKNSKSKGYKGKSGNRNYKPRNKQSKSSDVDDFKEDTRGNINNPSYYYGDANVLGQVMNFSFNEFGGVPVDMHIYPSKAAEFKNMMIATYWLNPSIPIDDSVADPLGTSGTNTAALRNFLALSGSNAKTTNYAPQDVVILELAIAELIKVATFTARVFGITPLFNYRNRTYPQFLIRAQGIDPEDLMANLATYRVRYNRLLTLASKIPFPADIPLFRKAAELYSSIYMDDPNSALAQTYMFCPFSTWIFDEEYDDNGAGLVTHRVLDADTPVTMGAWLDHFESMISALANSTSLNAIYSDVMRLVQNGKINSLITFNSIPEDFVIVPVYNEEIKIWLHNAIFMGEPLVNTQQFSVTGNAFTHMNNVSCDAGSNRLWYHPQFRFTETGGYEALLDFDHDQVTLEDKVRATRLSQRYHLVKNTNDNAYYTDSLAFNDEYLVCATYWVGTPNHEADMHLNHSFAWPNSVEDAVYMADGLSKFDWSPLMYLRDASNDPDKWVILGDLDYYTLVDQPTVQKMYNYEIITLLQIG